VLTTLAGEVRKEVSRLEGLMSEAGGAVNGNPLLEKVLKALGEVPEEAGEVDAEEK
jgi:hypothetical protein